MKSYKIILVLLVILILSEGSVSQNIETVSILDFGAKPNDGKDDHEAFEKLSNFINKRKGNVVVRIPTGDYYVGRQIRVKESGYYLTGLDVINIQNSKNVKIVGEPGARLLFNVGVRFGTFNTQTGLSTNKTFNCIAKDNIPTERAMLGKVINIFNSENVTINNIELDGNFYAKTLNNMNNFDLPGIKSNKKFQNNKINIGGGYGDCGIQIEHYGIFILHSSNIDLKNIKSNRFGTDGLMIANVAGKFKNVVVDHCTFDGNSRTGIAIGGGEDIRITNTNVRNTATTLYIATATGINIEPEADAIVHNKTAKNIKIDNCIIEDNSEGAILAKFGGNSENVSISNCTIKSSRTAVVIGSNSTNFEYVNNNLNGDLIVDDKIIEDNNNKSLKVFNKVKN